MKHDGKKNSNATTLWRASACALAVAGLLAACGGGGGGSTMTTVTGKVIDGYIEGATVVLDVNGNGVYDEGTDIKTTSKADGTYSFEAETSKVASSAILVTVPVGAKDADAPDGKVAAEYHMAAAPGQTTVTPLTTMVYAQMVSQAGGNGATLQALSATERQQLKATAEQALKASWGLKDSDDLGIDIVANQADAPKLRNIALASAKLLQEGKAAAAKNTGASSATVTSQSLVYALGNLSGIANTKGMDVANALASGEAKTALENTISSLKSKTKEQVTSDAQMVARTTLLAQATATDVIATLKSGEFTSLNFSQPDPNAQGYSYTYFTLNRYLEAGQPLFQNTYSYSKPITGSGSWYSSPPIVSDAYWSYVGGQWKLFEPPSGATFADVGNSTFENSLPNGDTSYKRQRTLKVVDLAGVKMALANANNSSLSQKFADTDVYPAGAKMLVYGPRMQVSERLTAQDDSIGTTSFDSQIIWKDPAGTENRARAASFADVLAAYADTGARGLGFSPGAYLSGTGCVYFGAGSSSGKLYFRGRDANGRCTGKDVTVGSNFTYVKSYDGTWEIVQRMGQDVMLLNWTNQPAVFTCSASGTVGSSPRCIGTENVLVVVDGKVRYGSYHTPNTVVASAGTSWNREALNAMLEKFGFPAAPAYVLDDFSGTWTGTSTSYGLNPDVRNVELTLTQSGITLKGTVKVFNGNTLVSTGSLLGLVSDGAASYRVTNAMGSYVSPNETCRSNFAGNLRVGSSGAAVSSLAVGGSQSSVGGSYSGVESCKNILTSPAPSGYLTLEKKAS